MPTSDTTTVAATASPDLIVYDLIVRAPALNASVGFDFSIDGVPFNGTGGSFVVVHGLSHALHSIAGISAGPAAAGWAYFGSSDAGTEFEVPEVRAINLTFAYVNLSSPVGTVTFTNSRIPVGTLWQVEFNGSYYSSPFATISVTARAGAYEIFAPNVTSDRGTTIWSALPFVDPTYVTVGELVNVTFKALFAIAVYAGYGGIAFGTYPLPSGANQTYTGIHFFAANTTVAIRAIGDVGWYFAGWAGTGVQAYSGPEPRNFFKVYGPATETATFLVAPPTRSVVRFIEDGIPNGTIWTVILNGTAYSSGLSFLVIPGLIVCNASTPGVGHYSLFLPADYANATTSYSRIRYVPEAYNSTVCGGAIVTLGFTLENLVSASSTGGGSVSLWANGSASQGAWVAPGGVVYVNATPAAGYQFMGWLGDGPGSSNGTDPTLVLHANASIHEIAIFASTGSAPSTRYSVTIAPSVTLSSGSTWSFELDNTTYSSTAASVTLTQVPGGNHDLTAIGGTSLDGLTQYVPAGPATPLTVPTSGPVPVPLAPTYWVAVGSVGLGTVSPGAGWLPDGTTVNLVASPAGGDDFYAWTGSGNGSYSGSSAASSIVVHGPVVEVATFTGVSSTTATPSDIWRNPGVLAGVAAVGFLIGLVPAFLHRFGRPPARVRPSTSERPATGSPP